jgi:hypothetical protein
MEEDILQKDIHELKNKIENLETLFTEKLQHLEQLININFGHLKEKTSTMLTYLCRK